MVVVCGVRTVVAGVVVVVVVLVLVGWWEVVVVGLIKSTKWIWSKCVVGGWGGLGRVGTVQYEWGRVWVWVYGSTISG